MPKLVQTWAGSWRVEPGGSEHVRELGDIATGQTKEVNVVRMGPYADSSLVVGAEVREVFEMTKHQGKFEFADAIWQASGASERIPGTDRVGWS